MNIPDDPPIREFADRGILWLLESPQNLADLLRLLSSELAAQLDFPRAQRINRSFVPPNLHKQEADMLVRIPFLNPTTPQLEMLVYILVEHQSEPDEVMGLRLLSYIVQVWELERREWQRKRVPRGERRLTPIVPVVFYTGTRRWERVPTVADLMDLPPMCSQFVPKHDTLYLNLHSTPSVLLEASTLGWALRALQSMEEPQEALAQVLASAVRYLESLPEAAQAEWRRAIQFLLLLVQHKRDPQEQPALRDVVIESALRKHQEEVREMAMTGAQYLEEKGRQEGRQEGMRQMLLTMMEQKFAPLPPEVSRLLASLPEAELTQIGARTFTATTLEDLELPL